MDSALTRLSENNHTILFRPLSDHTSPTNHVCTNAVSSRGWLAPSRERAPRGCAKINHSNRISDHNLKVRPGQNI